MGETNHNLWAPWRMEYIAGLHNDGTDDGCFLCTYWAEPARDGERYVIWRRGGCMVVLNRYPYTNGHLLIAPGQHTADLGDLTTENLTEMMALTRDAQRLLGEVNRAEGFNVGMNFGRCAGAGVPDHLHLHVVPRWNGDTNFMSVLGDARVVPQSLDALYARLADAAPRLGLPALVGVPNPAPNPSPEP